MVSDMEGNPVHKKQNTLKTYQALDHSWSADVDFAFPLCWHVWQMELLMAN